MNEILTVIVFFCLQNKLHIVMCIFTLRNNTEFERLAFCHTKFVDSGTIEQFDECFFLNLCMNTPMEFYGCMASLGAVSAQPWTIGLWTPLSA